MLGIGSKQFDPGRAVLFSADNKEIYLRPKTMLVLAMLAENAGSLVSKDDIIARVWSHVAVTDESLSQCISEIRRALGSKDRKYLKTYPKRGFRLEVDATIANTAFDSVVASIALHAYPVVVLEVMANRASTDRFCAAVIKRAEEALASPALHGCTTLTILHKDPTSAIDFAIGCAKLAHDAQIAARLVIDRVQVAGTPVPRLAKSDVSRLRKLARTGFEFDVLATAEFRESAIDTVDCLFWDQGEVFVGKRAQQLFGVAARDEGPNPFIGSKPEKIRPVIAVVPPYAPMSGRDETISDLFTDDLIASLSRLRDLDVISRLSTTNFRNRNASLFDLNSCLNADFIVSGTLRTIASATQLEWQMISSADGSIVQAGEAEISLDQLLTGKDLVQKIAARIQSGLANASVERISRTSVENLESFTLLFAAIGLMHRLNRSDFAMAKRLLDILESRDLRAAAPHAWAARWHVLRVQQGWSENPMAEAQEALRHADLALETEPENIVALSNRGFVLTNLLRDLGEARQTYDQALEINPNDAPTRLLRGMLFAFEGAADAAVTDVERALVLAPADPHRFFYLSLAAAAHVTAENHERALHLAKQSWRLNRSHTSTLRTKISAEVGLNEIAEARKSAKELLLRQPDLRVSEWVRFSPGAQSQAGQRVAEALRIAGIPE